MASLRRGCFAYVAAMTVLVRAPTQEECKPLAEIQSATYAQEMSGWARWHQMLAAGHPSDAGLRVVLYQDAIVGGLGLYRFGQMWGGGVVSAVGYAGVAIAAEARGLGLAKTLMLETMREASRHAAIALLYPSTLHLYRAVGFETGGQALRMEAPISAFVRGDSSLAMTRFESQKLTYPSSTESKLARALYAERSAKWNGQLARNESIWLRIAAPKDVTAHAYFFGDLENPEGYVVYTQPCTAALHFDIAVRDLVITTPRAASRWAGFLHAQRALAGNVFWTSGGACPMVAMLDAPQAKVVEHAQWMLRILDVQEALTTRGYAHDGEACFALQDAVMPSNSGAFRLRVNDGVGHLERIAKGGVPLVDVRALGALFSGSHAPETLRLMGLVACENEEAERQLGSLSRLFHSHLSWLPDYF